MPTPPTFSGTSQFGPFRLSKLRGKWVVIDFCTTWCAPCNLMAERTPAVIETIKSNGIPFEYVTVLLENDDHQVATATDGYSWAQTYGVRTPILTPEGLSKSMLRQQWIGYGFALPNRAWESGPNFPTVVVIDPTGRIASVTEGLATPSNLFARIKRSSLSLVDNRLPFTLLNYAVDVTYDTQTATFNNATLNTQGSVLSPDGGNATSLLKLFRVSTGFPNYVTEKLYFGIDLNNTQPPIPHNIFINIDLKQLTWDTGGPGFFLERKKITRLNGGDGSYYEFEFGTDSPTDFGSGFTSYADDGVAADFDVYSEELHLEWLRQHPDSLFPYIVRELPGLHLTKVQNSSLLVPLQAALRLYQVEKKPVDAVAKLQRFKTLLLSLKSKSDDPGLADIFVKVTDLVSQELGM